MSVEAKAWCLLCFEQAQPDVNVLSHGRSPLSQAVWSGHEAAARLLIHAGADVNFVDPEDMSSVLHKAILGGHERLGKELMMGGADVHARDSFDRTPLHRAAGIGFDGIVSILLLRGVDKDAVDNDGSTALMLACGADDETHPAVVETLLAAGADLNFRSPSGASALSCACRRGNVPIIQTLVRHGADVDSRDDIGGRSALHVAAVNDQACSVEALIEAGAEMEMKTHLGRTPLNVAAETGSPNALLALLQKGAITSAQDNQGDTPLHQACFFQSEGMETVVDNLLRWGADETALNNYRESPGKLLDAAPYAGRTCSSDAIERVRLLLSRAPADRAWRRRGWLAMLRSRASRANANPGEDEAEESNDAGGGAGECRKVARSEGAVDVGGGEGGQASNDVDEVGNEMLGVVVDGVLSDVDRLVVLMPEDVFRTVLAFL